MGKVLITVPQKINFEYQISNIDVAQKLIQFIDRFTQQKDSENRILGLFEDDPELMDEITEMAMQNRENHPLRITHSLSIVKLLNC